MKKTILVVLIVSLLTAGLCGCGSGFVRNESSAAAERQSVPGNLAVYGGEDIGFSFLYPYGLSVSWNEADGACISSGEGKIPYVLVSKTGKSGMTPEKYFRASDRQMLKEFDYVQSSSIHEVPLGEKTLYMTRYQCSTGSTQLCIDRYIELYSDCYIQYTAVTNTAEEMNTALYYAATTLSPEAGSYVGEYSASLTAWAQADTGLSIQLPDMLELRELTIGYLASGNDALLLAVVCTEDDNGNPIYNRQNFMDCAAADPDFVAGYIGADSTVFGAGDTVTINGREFYAYPMTMQTADEHFTGEIFLANAEENGCVVLCYAVRDDSARFDALAELCLQSVYTVEY